MALVANPTGRAFGGVARVGLIGRDDLVGGGGLVRGLTQTDLPFPDEISLDPGAPQDLNGAKGTQ